MGYTTDFEGRLKFSRALTVPEFNQLKALGDSYEQEDYKKVNPKHPDSYLQWVPSSDGEHLEWNGGEKFYEYTEWLQWLVDNWFKPRKITLQGRINYQGEEIGDVGYIEVLDDQHVRLYELKPTGIIECPNCGESFKPRDAS